MLRPSSVRMRQRHAASTGMGGRRFQEQGIEVPETSKASEQPTKDTLRGYENRRRRELEGLTWQTRVSLHRLVGMRQSIVRGSPTISSRTDTITWANVTWFYKDNW